LGRGGLTEEKSEGQPPPPQKPFLMWGLGFEMQDSRLEV